MTSQNSAKSATVKETKASDVKTNDPRRPPAPASHERRHVTSRQLPLDKNSTMKGHCNIHDFKHTVFDTSDRTQYDCVRSQKFANLRICLYPTAKDVYVSGSIHSSGAWEGHVTRGVLEALKRYPNASFLDVGANIGMHSLVVAQTGRKVVAVEPKLETVKRLHKSVNLNNLTDKITLIKNAVSDKRES